jgi:hypothetical protein
MVYILKRGNVLFGVAWQKTCASWAAPSGGQHSCRIYGMGGLQGSWLKKITILLGFWVMMITQNISERDRNSECGTYGDSEDPPDGEEGI